VVQGGAERTRSALNTGIGTVVGSRMGRLLATGVDAVLGKSEELVERYLPGTDEELGECRPRHARHHLPNLGRTPGFLVTPPRDLVAEASHGRAPLCPRNGVQSSGGAHPSTGGGMFRCPAWDGPATRFSSPGPAAAAAGVEVASPERQRRRQSYFVRVGSLSAKLRHRALRR
ncbi:Perilipin-3, partial [Eudyptes chrysolophus]